MNWTMTARGSAHRPLPGEQVAGLGGLGSGLESEAMSEAAWKPSIRRTGNPHHVCKPALGAPTQRTETGPVGGSPQDGHG